MQLVSAHDLTTGAAFVLPAHVRCVAATARLHAREVDSALPPSAIAEGDVKTLGSCPAGSIVYVQWNGPDWLKLRVVRSDAPE